MKKRFVALVALFGLSACQSEHYNQAVVTEGVDYTVAPQHNFYRYVNGKWLEKAQIPADRTSWGTLSELNEMNEVRSIALLKEIIADPRFKDDPKALRLKALYQTYTDLDARERLGLMPIQANLAKIDQIKNFDDLIAYLIEETKKGNEVLFGWNVFGHLKNSRQNAVYFSNQDPVLSKEYYQKETPENAQILKQYREYIVDVLRLLGAENPNKIASDIIAFEKSVAKTLSTNEERDLNIHYNPYTMAELAKASRHIDLAEFLRAVGVESPEIIVWEAGWLKQFDTLINPQNLAVLKHYLRFRLVSDSAGYLNKTLDELSFDFFGRKLIGQKQQRSLDKRALRLINAQIGQEFAQFYVEKYFPARAKQDLKEMADYLIKAYHQRIDQLDWMSAETKTRAKAKLDKFTVEIGYPNKWKDYRELRLHPLETGGNLYQNIQAIAQWNYQDALKKIGQPVDASEWGMLPQVVNASYSPLMNRIVFPAGILQPPLYDIQADPAVNFGAIGAIIGHELTHGFDDSGSKFDGDGNLSDWWSEADRKQFEILADQLVAQFNQLEVSPKVFVNGRFTLGENIADLGGLSIAYDALNLYMQKHGNVPLIENLTQPQRFFMSWARSWRNKATVQSLTHQVKSDPHAPAEFRAYVPLLNINAFHNAFGTKQGDAMFKPINQRIRIW